MQGDPSKGCIATSVPMLDRNRECYIDKATAWLQHLAILLKY